MELDARKPTTVSFPPQRLLTQGNHEFRAGADPSVRVAFRLGDGRAQWPR